MEHSTWKNLCDPVCLWYGLIFAVFFFTAVNMDTTIHVDPGLIYIEFLPKGHHKPIEIWLVVYLPLWKIWVRQLGWWNSQYMDKHKILPNHQSEIYWNDPVTWSLTGLKGVDVTVFQQPPSAMVSPRIHWHRLMFLLRRLRQFWQILCWPVLPCFGSSKSHKPQPIAEVSVTPQYSNQIWDCKSCQWDSNHFTGDWKNHFRGK